MPMIVVADTSVVLNLCRIQQEALLRQLFQRVLIPSLVESEFTRLAGVQARFAGLILPAWMEILPNPVQLPLEVVRANLDSGESAAIALCLNEKADALLIDETLGRRVAEKLGLRAIGILGVLVRARQRGLVPSVLVLLDQLEKEAGFWIAPELRKKVLHAVGE